MDVCFRLFCLFCSGAPLQMHTALPLHFEPFSKQNLLLPNCLLACTPHFLTLQISWLKVIEMEGLFCLPLKLSQHAVSQVHFPACLLHLHLFNLFSSASALFTLSVTP